MAQIAEAAGLGVSSLYYYFRNKHEIVERIVVDANRAPLDLAAAARARHPDAARQLHAFVRADVAALCHVPFDINEIHRLASDDAESFARYWADRERLVQEITAIVNYGITSGDFVAVAPALAAVTILANDEAVQNWYRPRPAGAPRPADVDGLGPDQIGLFVADQALRGLLRDIDALGVIRADTATVEPA